jgi:hypothetical protein
VPVPGQEVERGTASASVSILVRDPTGACIHRDLSFSHRLKTIRLTAYVTVLSARQLLKPWMSIRLVVEVGVYPHNDNTPLQHFMIARPTGANWGQLVIPSCMVHSSRRWFSGDVAARQFAQTRLRGQGDGWRKNGECTTRAQLPADPEATSKPFEAIRDGIPAIEAQHDTADSVD